MIRHTISTRPVAIRSIALRSVSIALLVLTACAHSAKNSDAPNASAPAASPPKKPAPAVGDMSAVSAAFTPPKPKYGPKEHPLATPLSQASAYFRSSRNRAPDFWTMIPYYVPQQENTCSAATVAMVLNALDSQRKKTADEKIISQGELLDTITAPGWKKSALNRAKKSQDAAAIREEERKFAANADKDGNCASLEELEEIVKEALALKNISAKVKRVNISPDVIKDPESKAYKVARMKFVRDLVLNESTADNYIILNFNQKAFTDDADAGHMAPVGAFNPITEKVLVLDPDRDYYEPYWVTADSVMNGMGTITSGGKTSRGYLLISRTGAGSGSSAADDADANP